MNRLDSIRSTAKPTRQPQSLPGRVGSVVKPTEHGGWGLTLEPILLGLLVAPSVGGLLLGLSVFIGFLARQPAKIVTIDRRRNLHKTRTVLALRVGFALTLLSTLLFLLAWLAGGRAAFLLPLLLALPAGLVFAYYDLTRPGRTLQAELSGPVALASVAASIALLAGWTVSASLPLWAILVARALPAVLYVRARIRLDHGRPVNTATPTLWHLVALALVVLLVGADRLPWTAAFAMIILLLRCIIMLLPRRPRVSIKTIGFSEMGLGLLTVLLVALGYWRL